MQVYNIMIPWAKPSFDKEEKKHLSNALNSTWISDGKYLKLFEKKISNLLKIKNLTTVNNGTSAIHLAYLALNIKRNDEIILPGYGYMAAANLALQIGAKPVFADVDINTFCITAENIKKKISKRTKLIVVIHTYGNVCDLGPILILAKKFKIPVLEDCAESFGSKYNKKYSGSYGDISTFSFQATKTLTTGEGGMVATKFNKTFFDKLISIKNHGIKKKRYYHTYPGHNFRLTNLQAAIGYAQFKKRSKIFKARKKIYINYKNLFENIQGIKLQKFDKNVSPVYWTFAIVLNDKKFVNRDHLIKLLLKEGIETRNGFYSPCRLPLYNFKKKLNLKNSNFLSKNVICFPFYNTLGLNQINFIYKKFLKLVKKKN